MEAAASDPEPITAFVGTLGAHDPKTVAAYRAVLRAFVAWLAQQPGGQPFRVEIVTETARGYLDHLAALGRAPQTRAKSRTALHRFCRWAQAEGLLRRNPVAAVEVSPTT
jgi:site-specific recombinase XerD